jgi:phospholipid-translocating ATPase
MLRGLFTSFDESCLAFGVYKLYTIGDCYVVYGVNNANKRNYGEEVIYE